MPISGLVVTLCSDDSRCHETLAALQSHEGIQLGPREDDRLALVLETPDSQSDRQVWEWLQSLPGVVQIEIAVIHFDEGISTEREEREGVEEVASTGGGPREFSLPVSSPQVASSSRGEQS